jgi:hypothetical protein
MLAYSAAGLMCQLVRLDRIKQSMIAVPPPHDRRVTGARPFGVLRARPGAFPLERVLGPPRLGDNRTPLARWQDFHFRWEQHFYG